MASKTSNTNDAADVVADPSLSDVEKLKVLEVMEQDARQLSTAAAEGMEGGEVTQLHEVLVAKEEVEAAGSDPAPGSDAEVEAEFAKERLDP